MSEQVLWAWYVAGALSTLAIKWASYVYHGRKIGKSAATASREWFLEATVENAVSWTTSLANLAIAWTVGRAYINRLPVWDFLGSLPLDNSISFLLGIVAEIAGPNAMKWMLSRLPGGSQ